jgi:REP element-mobilizing transposase RayT
MIHGYHVILTADGFWLPNDPRGSLSDFVGKWDLVRFGKATTSSERAELSPTEKRKQAAARRSLKYPSVSFTGIQARAIGDSFALTAEKNGYTIWACAILPEHTHLVIARHRYKVEQVANLLKGQSTTRLIDDGLHPLASYANPGERPPRMWSEHQWKVYLDTEEAIDNAIAYVNDNPIKEGKPSQHWSCVTPFTGLDAGWVTYL